MSSRPAGAIALAFVVAAAVALDAPAQPVGRIPRVGVLAPGSPPGAGRPGLPHLDAFRQGFRELGHVEGRTITFGVRWDGGKPHRYAALAAELVRLALDVIVAATTGATLAARDASGAQARGPLPPGA